MLRLRVFGFGLPFPFRGGVGRFAFDMLGDVGFVEYFTTEFSSLLAFFCGNKLPRLIFPRIAYWAIPIILLTTKYKDKPEARVKAR